VNGWQRMLGSDLLTLGMRADEARRALPEGNVVTYTRVHVMTLEHLRGAITVPDAAAELRVYGTPESLGEAVEAVQLLRRAAGDRRVSAFSFADILARAWPPSEALAALVTAGLNDVAELPADLIDDLPAALEALRAAGADPQRITVAHAVSDRKIDVIARVQEAIGRSGAPRRFSPLPRSAPVDKPTTGYDDVRMVALSRLALGDVSIEVDWMLYGPKLAQVALTFGADHLDAVPADDHASLGRRRATVEDVERNIRAAGFEPRPIRPQTRVS
jgi:hypothetical protein